MATVALLALAPVPADATSNRTYKKKEYALIKGGRSPDRRHALATHGNGEFGYDNFHVYLMAEPGHRRLTPLPDIGADVLDTGPDAFWAAWSPDSRNVAVSYRINRHVMETKLYRIEGARARRITGPSAFKAATRHDVAEFEDDNVNASTVTVDWTGPTRFVLMERYRFRTRSADLPRILGRFAKTDEPESDGQMFVQFAAEATCVLLPEGGYRILAVQPGPLED